MAKCNARTASGKLCQKSPMKGKLRCELHLGPLTNQGVKRRKRAEGKKKGK